MRWVGGFDLVEEEKGDQPTTRTENKLIKLLF